MKMNLQPSSFILFHEETTRAAAHQRMNETQVQRTQESASHPIYEEIIGSSTTTGIFLPFVGYCAFSRRNVQ
jgi:hypothetical protein